MKLYAGKQLVLTEEDVPGTAARIHQTFPGLHEYVQTGSTILLDDGLIELAVDKVDGTDILCTVQNPGTLGQRKQLNIPDITIPLPIITKQDERDLRFGIEMGVDYIAASFVRNAEDVRAIRTFLDKNGGTNIDIMCLTCRRRS